MAKKRKVTKKRPKAKLATKKSHWVPKTEEDQLLILIKHSENAITTQGTGVDEFFIQQTARLKKKLEELRNGTSKDVSKPSVENNKAS